MFKRAVAAPKQKPYSQCTMQGTMLEQRISRVPTKIRRLDIALIVCQYYFVTGLFPSHYNAVLHSCITVQAAANVHLYLFSFLSSPSK